MKSCPSADEVVDDLGSKVVDGIARAVRDAKTALATYRQVLPAYALQQSERGLANWVHDQLWFYLNLHLGDVPEVSFIDQEPHREIFVGTRYRFRVKRHSSLGRVRSYPTQTVLNFYEDGPVQRALEGLEEVCLTMGYAWDREMRDLGPAVMTLPKNTKEPEWVYEFPAPTAASGTVVTPVPPRIEPPKPSVEVESDDDATESGNES